MSFTPPPGAPPAAAPIPSRRLDDQETFDSKTDTYLTWTEAFRTWLAGFVIYLADLLPQLSAAVDTVGGYMANALVAADAAKAAANFKGLWPGMVGELRTPASVKNNGRFWLLVRDVADVAASEPGPGNPDWTSSDAGVIPSQTISINTTAVPGVRYTFGASGIVLTLALDYVKGDYQGVRTLEGVSGCSVIFGNHKYLGREIGTLVIDVNLFRLDVNYENIDEGMQ